MAHKMHKIVISNGYEQEKTRGGKWPFVQGVVLKM